MLLADSAPLRGLLTGEQSPTTSTDVAWVLGYLLTVYGLAFCYIVRDARRREKESNNPHPPKE
jgi:hypothetical protein